MSLFIFKLTLNFEHDSHANPMTVSKCGPRTGCFRLCSYGGFGGFKATLSQCYYFAARHILQRVSQTLLSAAGG